MLRHQRSVVRWLGVGPSCQGRTNGLLVVNPLSSVSFPSCNNLQLLASLSHILWSKNILPYGCKIGLDQNWRNDRLMLWRRYRVERFGLVCIHYFTLQTQAELCIPLPTTYYLVVPSYFRYYHPTRLAQHLSQLVAITGDEKSILSTISLPQLSQCVFMLRRVYHNWKTTTNLDRNLDDPPSSNRP